LRAIGPSEAWAGEAQGGPTLRLLVLDAYAREGREELRRGGVSEAGALYVALLRSLESEAQVEVGHPADADWQLPQGSRLADWDGAVWTGSSLTIHDEADLRVQRQVELARQLYQAGVPCFGSCWGIQLAVVAAGGTCARNPRGREFGISRKIEVCEAGRAHPLYAGKSGVFDALTSHQDEVVRLPPAARLLASNRISGVQAMALEEGERSFWAVQYHPEYDLGEVARLCRVRATGLVAQGCFRDRQAAEAWCERLLALDAQPQRQDLAFALGVDEDVLDPGVRCREVRNWLDQRVKPRASRLRGG